MANANEKKFTQAEVDNLIKETADEARAQALVDATALLDDMADAMDDAMDDKHSAMLGAEVSLLHWVARKVYDL